MLLSRALVCPEFSLSFYAAFSNVVSKILYTQYTNNTNFELLKLLKLLGSTKINLNLHYRLYIYETECMAGCYFISFGKKTLRTTTF